MKHSGVERRGNGWVYNLADADNPGGSITCMRRAFMQQRQRAKYCSSQDNAASAEQT